MPTRAPSVFALPASGDPQRPAFTLEKVKDAYTRQYANLYWLRLVVLRPRVQARAKAKWGAPDGKYANGKRHSRDMTGWAHRVVWWFVKWALAAQLELGRLINQSEG